MFKYDVFKDVLIYYLILLHENGLRVIQDTTLFAELKIRRVTLGAISKMPPKRLP